jgi:DNA-binding transcriptional regulator LsrR (DeoR family)
MRNALYSNPHVCRTLELARTADLALIGIGSSDSDSVGVPDLCRFLPPDALPDLLAKGAVGSIKPALFQLGGTPHFLRDQ